MFPYAVGDLGIDAVVEAGVAEDGIFAAAVRGELGQGAAETGLDAGLNAGIDRLGRTTSVEFGAASGFQLQPRSRKTERSIPGGAYQPPAP